MPGPTVFVQILFTPGIQYFFTAKATISSPLLNRGNSRRRLPKLPDAVVEGEFDLSGDTVYPYPDASCHCYALQK